MRAFQYLVGVLFVFVLGLALVNCVQPKTRVKPEKQALAQKVFVTGSHIKHPVDPNTGRVQTAWPLRVYTQEQLNQTGKVQLGEALQQVSPTVSLTGTRSASTTRP